MTKARRILRLCIAILTAGTLFAGGCVPDNFYVDLWATVLTNTAATVADGIVTGTIQ